MDNTHRIFVQSFKEIYCSSSFCEDISNPNYDYLNFFIFSSREMLEKADDENSLECDIVIVAVICFLYNIQNEDDLFTFIDILSNKRNTNEIEKQELKKTLLIIHQAIIESWPEFFKEVSVPKLNGKTDFTIQNLFSKSWHENRCPFQFETGYYAAKIAALLKPKATIRKFGDVHKLSKKIFLRVYAIYLSHLTDKAVPRTEQGLINFIEKGFQLQNPESQKQKTSKKSSGNQTQIVQKLFYGSNTPSNSNKTIALEPMSGIEEELEDSEQDIESDEDQDENSIDLGTCSSGSGFIHFYLDKDAYKRLEKPYFPRSKRHSSLPEKYRGSTKNFPTIKKSNIKDISKLPWLARSEFRYVIYGSVYVQKENKIVQVPASSILKTLLPEIEREVEIISSDK